MKLTVFCIFLVAFADHGVRAGIISDGLGMVDNAADSAIEKAEEALAKVKESTDMLNGKVREMVDMFIMGVRKQVTGAVDKVDNSILEIIGSSKDPKVSECAELAGTLHATADAKVANVSNCALEKLEKVNEYIEFVYEMISESLTEIKQLKEDLKNCSNTNSVMQILGSGVCMSKVAVKAGVMTIMKIPKIAKYVIDLEAFVNTFPTSLAVCAAKAEILTFVENAGSIVIGVKDCVTEAIKGTTTQGPDVTEAPKSVDSEDNKVTELPKMT